MGALGRYNKEQKFKIIISYVASSRLSRETQTSVSNKMKQDLTGGSVGRRLAVKLEDLSLSPRTLKVKGEK